MIDEQSLLLYSKAIHCMVQWTAFLWKDDIEADGEEEQPWK